MDLRHGDIVILEDRDSTSKVTEYFIDLISWRQVDFKPVFPLSGASFENLKVSSKWNLKQLTTFLAGKLSVQPDHLRISFTSDSNCIVEDPVNQSTEALVELSSSSTHCSFLKSDNAGTVKDFLIGTGPVDTITIVYEVLPGLTITEAENQVRFVIERACDDNSDDEIIKALPQVVYLSPYVSSVTDLIKRINPTSDPKKYRLLKVQNGKIR